jgi:hypothetical protein
VVKSCDRGLFRFFLGVCLKHCRHQVVGWKRSLSGAVLVNIVADLLAFLYDLIVCCVHAHDVHLRVVCGMCIERGALVAMHVLFSSGVSVRACCLPTADLPVHSTAA